MQSATTDPPQAAAEPVDEPPSMPRGRAIDQGRRGWLRDARQRLDERRAQRGAPGPALARGAAVPSPSAASRRSLRPSAGRTRPMRPTGRAGSRATGAASAATRRAPTSCPTPRPGRSTRPTPTRACLKAAGIGYVQGYNAQAAVNEQPDRARRRDRRRLARLRAARADDERDRLRASNGRASPTHRRSSSPTPATGTTSRWTASPPAASGC